MSKRIEQSSVFAASTSPNYIVSPRSPDQLIADEAFLAKARQRSPKFPSITEALERRRHLREKIAARTMLFGIVAGLAGALYVGTFGLVASAFCLVGFTIICFVSAHHSRG